MNTVRNTSATRKSWRNSIAIHPVAQIFPQLSPEERIELGRNIKAHGLINGPVIFAEPINPEAPITSRKYEYSLLDGISRLDGMKKVGLMPKLHFSAKRGKWKLSASLDQSIPLAQPEIVKDIDPYEYVLSANEHRRHLTLEQKRELIAKLIKAKPERSNLSTARLTKADDKTVASVREELQARSEIPNVKIRIDTKGRKQPARKSPKSRKPEGRIQMTAPPGPTPERCRDTFRATPVPEAASGPAEPAKPNRAAGSSKPTAAKADSGSAASLITNAGSPAQVLRDGIESLGAAFRQCPPADLVTAIGRKEVKPLDPTEVKASAAKLDEFADLLGNS
jgi:hypothetical protein